MALDENHIEAFRILLREEIRTELEPVCERLDEVLNKLRRALSDRRKKRARM